jgi:hypothetical protein
MFRKINCIGEKGNSSDSFLCSLFPTSEKEAQNDWIKELESVMEEIVAVIC